MRSTPMKPTRSGLLAIGAMAAMGALLLVLLYLAPRFSRRAPNVPWGAPPAPIRVTIVDVQRIRGGITAAEDEVRRINPALVLLQGIDGLAGEAMAARLGFDSRGGVAFYPAQNLAGPNSPAGNMILSRDRMYEVRSMPNRGGSFGVWAVVVSQNMKYYVACAALSPGDATHGAQPHPEVATLLRAWSQLNSPPMLLGLRAESMTPADWGLLASAGLARTNASGTATAPADAPTSRVELLRSAGWQVDAVEGRVDGVLIVTLRGGG